MVLAAKTAMKGRQQYFVRYISSGAHGGAVVEALRYKPQGCRIVTFH
jgi:2-keto-3-deoxy-L-rhamnonate aldolase RhmA